MAEEKKDAKEGGKKPGRKPKAPQTMPLILSETRNRVSKELALDSKTAALIDMYSSWAAKKGWISKDEATMLLLAKAVPAFVKLDALFQAEGAKVKESAGAENPED